MVLSTISGTWPCLRATSAMALMSVTKVPPGLARLSMKIALVRSSIWASMLPMSAGSAQRTCQSKDLEGLAELVDRAAVKPARGDEVVARAHDGVEHQKLRGMARGHGQRCGAAFKRGDALFEHGLGRVHDAGVDVAEGLEAKQRGCVIGIVEDEDWWSGRSAWRARQWPDRVARRHEWQAC
jgi:hypothetical protein